MRTFERRLTPRFNLRIPLCFQPKRIPDGDLTAESRNISSRGVYFISSLPVHVGLSVQIAPRMPKEITGNAPPDVRLTGRVVRIHPVGSPVKKFGLAVEFDNYEAGWCTDIGEDYRPALILSRSAPAAAQ